MTDTLSELKRMLADFQAEEHRALEPLARRIGELKARAKERRGYDELLADAIYEYQLEQDNWRGLIFPIAQQISDLEWAPPVIPMSPLDRDLAAFGIASEKDGTRIDPADFYRETKSE